MANAIARLSLQQKVARFGLFPWKRGRHDGAIYCWHGTFDDAARWFDVRDRRLTLASLFWSSIPVVTSPEHVLAFRPRDAWLARATRFGFRPYRERQTIGWEAVELTGEREGTLVSMTIAGEPFVVGVADAATLQAYIDAALHGSQLPDVGE